jgi:hypothetical protein
MRAARLGLTAGLTERRGVPVIIEAVCIFSEILKVSGVKANEV